MSRKQPAVKKQEPVGVRVGRSVKARREALGLSQHGLADRAAFPQAAISRLEGGHTANPGYDELQKLAAALGCTAAELAGDDAPGATGNQAMLRFDQIVVTSLNPRQTIDEEGLQELAGSIAVRGILQPIRVRPHGDDPHLKGGPFFDLVMGERRYRAVERLIVRREWDRDAFNIPATVMVIDPKATAEQVEAEHELDALVENLQRQDMNPMDEAEGFSRLQTRDPATYTAAHLAHLTGKSVRFVQQRLQLRLKLHARARLALRNGAMNFAQARALMMTAPFIQEKAVDRIIAAEPGWVTEAEITARLAELEQRAATHTPPTPKSAGPSRSLRASQAPADAPAAPTPGAAGKSPAEVADEGATPPAHTEPGDGTLYFKTRGPLKVSDAVYGDAADVTDPTPVERMPLTMTLYDAENGGQATYVRADHIAKHQAEQNRLTFEEDEAPPQPAQDGVG